MKQDTQKLTVEDRSTEFVAVSGGQETTSAGSLLLSAYILMWVIVFAFIWLTSRKQKQLDARLLEVEQALGRANAASGSGAA